MGLALIDRKFVQGFVATAGMPATDIGLGFMPINSPRGWYRKVIITAYSTASTVSAGNSQLRARVIFDQDLPQQWTVGLQALDTFTSVPSAGPAALPTTATSGNSYKVVIPPADMRNMVGEDLLAYSLAFTCQGATTGDQTWSFAVNCYG